MRDDLAVALRRITRSPGSSALITALLAMVIFITACVFTVAYGMLWKPLPFPAQSRLVQLTSYSTKMGMDLGWSIPYLDTIARQSRELSAVAGYQTREVSLADTAGGITGTLDVVMAEPALFGMLGARAGAGRLFNGEDVLPGAEPVALVSSRFWRARFDAPMGTEVHKLHLDGVAYRIVGVLDDSFAFPDRSRHVWLPLSFSEEQTALGNAGSFGNLKAIAQLARSNGRLAAASEMMGLVYAVPTLANIGNQIGLKVTAVPLRSLWLEGRQGSLISMLVAALLVFAVTAANVYNLFVLRLIRRRQEMALLEAVGATRQRRLLQIVMESSLFAVGASLLAVGLMPLGLAGLRRVDVLPRDIPQVIGPDLVTLLAIVVMCATALLILLAAGRAFRGQSVFEVLRQTGNGQTASAAVNRLRRLLVMLQVGVTFVLLFCTALLVRSSDALLQEDVGFNRGGLLVGTLQSATSGGGEAARAEDAAADEDADAENVRARARSWTERVQALPGVRAVALTSSAPLSRNVTLEAFSGPVTSGGGQGEQPKAYLAYTGHAYPRALGVRILQGRAFSAIESEQGAPVALIDRALAERYFPGQDPQGRSLRVADGTTGALVDRVVVGVIERVRQRALAQQDEYPTIYLPDAAPLLRPEAPLSSAEFVVRTDHPGRIGKALQQQAQQAGLMLTQTMTMEQRIEDTIIDQLRLNALLRILSGVTLVLASVGLYAQLAQSVAMRQREFGVRQALGANRHDILRSVLLQGAWMVGWALVAALPVALLFGALLRERLHGISPFDPLSLSIVALMLSLVALMANALPAYRAAQIKPMLALRAE